MLASVVYTTTVLKKLYIKRANSSFEGGKDGFPAYRGAGKIQKRNP
jgi:hypothetical protein